jgi:hypothetical protein
VNSGGAEEEEELESGVGDKSLDTVKTFQITGSCHWWVLTTCETYDTIDILKIW